MQLLSMQRLALRRFTGDWLFLLSIFVGIVLATSTVASAPIYLRAIERLALEKTIDDLSRPFSNIHTFIFKMSANQETVQKTETAINTATHNHLFAIYESRNRYLTPRTWLLGTPSNPLSSGRSGELTASHGYLRSFTNIEQNVNFLFGRMATSELQEGPRGPIVESIVSLTSSKLFDLNVGDLVEMAKSIDDRLIFTIRIVGIVEPIDPTADFWQLNAALILDPGTGLDTGDDVVDGTAESEPILPLFITQDALINSINSVYPGTLIGSLWFTMVNAERLKELSLLEIQKTLMGYENELSRLLPGSEVNTGIYTMTTDFETRRFFYRVTLLLLLTTVVSVILFYLVLTTSYFVGARATDTAALKSRGMSNPALLQLYLFEGGFVTIVTSGIAPFLSLGVVALTGKLPYFRDIAEGRLLPVELGPLPFVVSFLTGLVCLSILVATGFLGFRNGFWTEKLISPKPTTTSLFHKYYIDIGLFIIVGLIFWELKMRGHIVSGGFFKEVEINEILLLAPILFFLAVGLAFIRFFPQVARYISGDSLTILHILTAGSLLTLGPAITGIAISNGETTAWVAPVSLLFIFGLIYWGTSFLYRFRYRIIGLVLQSLAIFAFANSRSFDINELLFIPYAVLLVIVPVQCVFLLLRVCMSYSPAWVSVAILRLARDPLRYAWLIIMLILATGVSVLSVTVGGSLDRSKNDQILYDVATDVRITNIPWALGRNKNVLKSKYLDIPDVISASLAVRSSGMVGRNNVEILALESHEFRHMSWYRDDFSDRTLGEVMSALKAHPIIDPITIPYGTKSIGMWLKPSELQPYRTARFVLVGNNGEVTNVVLGNVGQPEWHRVLANIPDSLNHPVRLNSVEFFDHDPDDTNGSFLIDDIHVINTHGETLILEDFEGDLTWLPTTVDPTSSDRISAIYEDVYRGRRAGLFSFSGNTDLDVRGFYQNLIGGPVPVVGNISFINAIGTKVYDSFNLRIAGTLIPVILVDQVEYFPTMFPSDSGFLLADLDSLRSHLRSLYPSTSTMNPNEAFLSIVPSTGTKVRQAIRLIQPAFGEIQEMQSKLESLNLDPLTSAGWRATVFLSQGIMLLAASLSYMSYMLSMVNQNRYELRFLKSIGFSSRQIIGLLGFENIAIVFAGLSIGTWSGLTMSNLMVSSINVTESGTEVLPPLLLMTDWSMLITAFSFFCVLFVSLILITYVTVNRPDFWAIPRSRAHRR